MKFRKLIMNALALGLAFYGISANAVVMLTLDNPGTSYQQQQNSPCIFGEPSCDQPTGWDYTEFPAGGGSTDYDLLSEIYTVQQFRDEVGDFFSVGIDVNTTTRPLATELLDLFTLSVNDVVEFSYDPDSPGTQLVTQANGNGFSDALLKGFDLSTFSPTDSLLFHLQLNNATDGREQFFLVSSDAPPAVIPEPGTMALLGLGILGLALGRRRRSAKAV